MKSPEELMRLASKWGSEDTGYKRNKDGTLKFWYEWSKSHPQRHDRKVQICQGHLEWTNALKNSDESFSLVSIVSWNILSETWFLKGRGNYAHTSYESSQWSYRFQCLLKWIKRLNSDVLALQEVDYEIFIRDLEPTLRKLGYEGVMQSPKNKSKEQPCGLAIFWKVSKFHQVKNVSFSRSMVIILQQSLNKHNRDDTDTQKKDICIANVHLECSQSAIGSDKRARQLNSALKWAKEQSLQTPECPFILCGDFNTGADSNLFNVLRNHKWHKHDLAMVYEHPSTSRTLPVCRATYAVPYHHYIVDHMLYSHKAVHLRYILNAFTEKETEEHLGSSSIIGPLNNKGFPNSFCPSDHIPIGAAFEIPALLSVSKGDLSNDSLSEVTTHKICLIDEDRRMKIDQELQNFIKELKSIKWKEKPKTDGELMLRRSLKSKVKEYKKSFEKEEKEYRYVSKALNTFNSY